MVATRTWRPSHSVDGPFRARLDDIADLNQVFSDAFTERYRRDGMVGVRVPYLNPAVWRYAIEDADAGAMLWRDDRGHIAAFNMVHRSGTEGWMGPLAVRTEYQGTGLGKEIVTRGIEWLKQSRAAVIGPRSSCAARATISIRRVRRNSAPVATASASTASAHAPTARPKLTAAFRRPAGSPPPRR